MDSSAVTKKKTEGTADIAFVGGGPASLVAAIALAGAAFLQRCSSGTLIRR